MSEQIEATQQADPSPAMAAWSRLCRDHDLSGMTPREVFQAGWNACQYFAETHLGVSWTEPDVQEKAGE